MAASSFHVRSVLSHLESLASTVFPLCSLCLLTCTWLSCFEDWGGPLNSPRIGVGHQDLPCPMTWVLKPLRIQVGSASRDHLGSEEDSGV